MAALSEAYERCLALYMDGDLDRCVGAAHELLQRMCGERSDLRHLSITDEDWAFRTLALGTRCAFERGRPDDGERLLCKYYPQNQLMPFPVFLLWAQCALAGAGKREACREVAIFIRSRNGPSAKLHLSEQQNAALYELLVFFGLVPLGAFAEARELLRTAELAETRRVAFLRRLDELQTTAMPTIPPPPSARDAAAAAAAAAKAPSSPGDAQPARPLSRLALLRARLSSLLGMVAGDPEVAERLRRLAVLVALALLFVALRWATRRSQRTREIWERVDRAVTSTLARLLG